MISANLERLVPGLAELREKERRTRAFAFGAYAGLTHTVCGVEVRPITPMHRLGLQLLKNAFAHRSAEPMEGDVFVFLWFLSPAAAWTFPGRKIAWAWLQWRLRRHVKRLYLQAAIREIHEYLVSQIQDLAESTGAESGSDHGPWVHWMAMDVGFWMNVHGGFTIESYLSTPYLVLQQLYRAWRCNHPNVTRADNGDLIVEDPQFINESDRLVGLWQRQHADAVRTRIINQRERKN